VSLVLDSSATLAWIYGDETSEPMRRLFDLVRGVSFTPGTQVPHRARAPETRHPVLADLRGSVSAANRARPALPGASLIE
jgi:hypothetical protein